MVKERSPDFQCRYPARGCEHRRALIAGTWSQSYILKRPGFDVVIDHAGDEVLTWPGNFHVGFELPSLDAVRELHARFQSEGVKMETDVFNNGRGSRFFCRARVSGDL
ncbi:hypothetical protein LMG18101_03423 [Ralstonia flaminis]|jgi:hypothetical protein|uniref:Uncharacterized protein n=2 Tax=Ralstonia flaminis TaxID=3058597 RepID=A0ABM9K718_9RALS|nr:hypothetical protein LMG18101_03423 [Ralstonia sp. LMG 18101]